MAFFSFLKQVPFIIVCSSMIVSVAWTQDKDNQELQKKEELSVSTLSEQVSNQKPLSQEISKSIVLEEEVSKPLIDPTSVPYPEEIYQELIKYTIGQEEAMRSLATFIHEHLVTVKLREKALEDPQDILLNGLVLEKPNILMMGPTGCGKTSSLNILARYLKVPFAVGNATEWTAQGYIGGKWQEVFEKLLSNAESLLAQEKKSRSKKNIRGKAEHGIVFIDEIDKLCTKSFGDLDVIDRVQQELLPAIQGTELKLDSGDIIDTSNILFIAGGAFPGLISSEESISSKKIITPQDLERYGMLPELAGRLCNIVQFNALSKEALKQIMTQSKNSFLTQYMAKYKIAYNIDLKVDEEAIDYIAELASQQKTGARAINSMIFKLMQEKTFNIKQYIGKPLQIDKKIAKKALESFVPHKEEKNPSHHMMYM